MRKPIAIASAILAGASSVLAQSSSSIIDTTTLATSANQIKADLTTFLSGTVGPVVLAICGAGFLIWLGVKLFRWARKAAG